MPATLAELVLLVAAVWLIDRLLRPLRLRLERFLLRLIDPSKNVVIDAEIIPRDPKKPKE